MAREDNLLLFLQFADERCVKDHDVDEDQPVKLGALVRKLCLRQTYAPASSSLGLWIRSLSESGWRMLSGRSGLAHEDLAVRHWIYLDLAVKMCVM